MLLRPLTVFLALLSVAGPVFAGQIQFVVAELPGMATHNDSYLISIDEDDAARLSHARALVQWVESGAAPEDSPGGTIVVANIAAGADGINRDVRAQPPTPWSWHTLQPVRVCRQHH